MGFRSQHAPRFETIVNDFAGRLSDFVTAAAISSRSAGVRATRAAAIHPSTWAADRRPRSRR